MKPLRKVAVLIETSRETGRELLRGVTRYHRENPNWSVYFKQQDLGASLPPWISRWHGDGILARVTDLKMAKRLMKTGLPMVDMRGYAHDLGLPLFRANERSVAQHAFDHLVSRGLKQFAFVGEPVGQHIYDDERRNAFVNLVSEHGSQCYLFADRLNRKSAMSWDVHQDQLADWLSQLPKPIGIMCCQDDRGHEVIDACQRVELQVPNEVAVIGVDNDEFICRLAAPSLTSVDIGSERIGYEAAALLDRLMSGEAKFDKSVLFDALRVVERQSTDIIACDDPEVARAIQFIRENACRQLTVDEVYLNVRLSRSLLNRRFKKYVGHSPKQEIDRVRMETAKRLLVTSSEPLQSIAEQCGFNEAWYFISVFRKFTGTTPGVFRKKQGRTAP